MIQFSIAFSSYLSIKHVNSPSYISHHHTTDLHFNETEFQHSCKHSRCTCQLFKQQADAWDSSVHRSLKAQTGISLLIYFSPFVLFISQWNQTLEQLQHQEWINPGYITTEVHLRSLWQNLTSSHACWHSLAVPVLPCDVMWGHISAVPNNGTEVSHLNHNGLSPPNKYLSACSCISNSAVQDLMGRYWLPCALSLG